MARPLAAAPVQRHDGMVGQDLGRGFGPGQAANQRFPGFTHLEVKEHP